MTETETEVNLDELTKDELLDRAHSLGIHPANAGMTKDELKEALEQAPKATGQASNGDSGNSEEEYGAEAVATSGPQPETEAVEPEQTDSSGEEYGAEARYWAGEYTDGVPPTEPPGGWPGEEAAAATVTDIAPATIALGPPADETLTITGTGFTEGSAATIDGAPLAASYTSDTSLTATIPAGTQPAAAVLSIAVDGSAPFAVTVA